MTKKASKKKALRKKTAKKTTSKVRTERNAKKEREAAKDKRREAQFAIFLLTLSDGGTVAEACKDSQLPRSTVYERRENDEDFDSAWIQAYSDGTDALESTARKRAQEKSDLLMIFLLKSRHQKFRGEGNPETRGRRKKVEFVVTDASDPKRKIPGED